MCFDWLIDWLIDWYTQLRHWISLKKIFTPAKELLMAHTIRGVWILRRNVIGAYFSRRCVRHALIFSKQKWHCRNTEIVSANSVLARSIHRNNKAANDSLFWYTDVAHSPLAAERRTKLFSGRLLYTNRYTGWWRKVLENTPHSRYRITTV